MNISRHEVQQVDFVGTIGAIKTVYDFGTYDNSIKSFNMTDVIISNYGTVLNVKIWNSSTGIGENSIYNVAANDSIVINRILPRIFIAGGTTGTKFYIYASNVGAISGRTPNIEISGYVE